MSVFSRSNVAPPPMLVVRKGWLYVWTREVSLDVLRRYDRMKNAGHLRGKGVSRRWRRA